MRVQLNVPNTTAVAAGQTASWDVPIGLRYHEFRLTYSGVTLAQMTQIRLVINGETIHRYSGDQRDKLNQYDGRAAAAGILTIPLDRYSLYRQDGEELTALRTGVADKNGLSINSCKIEIDVSGAAAAPAITINATASDNPAGGAGVIMRVLPFPRNFGASGDVEWADLPNANQGSKYLVLNRTAFFASNITKLEFSRDNKRVSQLTKALNERQQVDGVRVPQSGLWVFDPTYDGYDFEGVSLVQPDGKTPYADVRYLLSLSGSENITALVEYLGNLS